MFLFSGLSDEEEYLSISPNEIIIEEEQIWCTAPLSSPKINSWLVRMVPLLVCVLLLYVIDIVLSLMILGMVRFPNILARSLIPCMNGRGLLLTSWV